MIGTIAAGIILALTMAAPTASLAAPPPDGTVRLAQAQPGGSRKVFHATGIVTANEPAGTLTINHEPIVGLMPAMEMMFKANPPSLTNGVRPGDKVEFSVEGKTFVLVGLKVLGHVK
jgi:Cu/Ag efflux protein CusF